MKIKYFFMVLGLCLILSSCAQAPIRPANYPKQEIYPQLPQTFLRHDLYHVVGPGETLWRISKMYDVKMRDIAKVNSLRSPEALKMGQRIFIAGAAPIRPVVPLYRSNKWRNIIIHHSATEEGNALSLYYVHNRRGFSGLGYDFIINNGSNGKSDGQIEASPRWIKQQDGAHCKASGMNHKGIGICLVGNFSKERVSRAQLNSLAYLVNILRRYYNIPTRNILGHGQVRGARTECPGKFFPWNEFKSRL